MKKLYTKTNNLADELYGLTVEDHFSAREHAEAALDAAEDLESFLDIFNQFLGAKSFKYLDKE